MRFPARNEALKAARLRRGVYRCEACGDEFGRREVEVDHIEAVGPTPGSRNACSETTWDVFIERMFCSSNALQILCKDCHRKK